MKLSRLFPLAPAALLALGALSGCAFEADAPALADTLGTRYLVNRDRDGLAVQGYDVVAYFTESRAVKGDPRYRVAWGGAAYQFASAENQARF